MDTYHCSQKLAYNTSLLIDEAQNLIPENIRAKLSAEIIEDIKQAGRCLAFELSTASSFHMLRATEGVIRMYYNQVVGPLPSVKVRNWGAYIRVLNQHGANKKITGNLDHIRQEYRNPVLHPDQFVSNDESVVFLNTCIAAIVEMVNETEKLKSSPPALPFPPGGLAGTIAATTAP